MKLKLKHLAPYLPYGLKVQIAYFYYKGMSTEMVGLTEDHAELIIANPKTQFFDLIDFKPILRPLSDLTQEIEHNGEKFIPLIKINNELHYDWKFDIKDNYFIDFGLDYKNRFDTAELPFDVIQKFCEWHFDIFGLIPEGLAIDINTLK